MFDRLKKRFWKAASGPVGNDGSAEPLPYLNGAYRVHRKEDVARFTKLAADAFPTFASRIECFGADWLGRQFATDKLRVLGGEPQVLLLEPGSGEVFEIPTGFATFHGQDLLRHPNEVAEYLLFKEWLDVGGAPPEYNQCMGYSKPLFLGGENEVSNLELSDFDVYWTICGQLLAQVRALPEGTKINRVTIR